MASSQATSTSSEWWLLTGRDLVNPATLPKALWPNHDSVSALAILRPSLLIFPVSILTKFALLLLFTVAPRIDRKNLQKKMMRVGQLLRIEADIQGEPPPAITWKLKDAVLKSMDRLKIENEDYHTTFIMSKLQRSDAGTYTVIAKNDSGTDQVDVEIQVLSKPGKPKGPLEVSNVTAEGCKLKWEKPDDDGGEPVDHYVVERMDVDTGRWVPCATSKTPEADVTGLNEGKDYLFRVKAVNSEGESEPLETPIPTTAKNPYSKHNFYQPVFLSTTRRIISNNICE